MIGDVILYAMKRCCSDWLINKAVWPMVRQNAVRWNILTGERRRKKREKGDTASHRQKKQDVKYR